MDFNQWQYNIGYLNAAASPTWPHGNTSQTSYRPPAQPGTGVWTSTGGIGMPRSLPPTCVTRSTGVFPDPQTTHYNPTAPILDLTADRPMFSSPNSVVDLTEKTHSSVPRSTQDTDDPTSHAASSHASSSESVTKELCYLVKVVDPTKKGQYKVHKLRVSTKFNTCCDIRSALKESLAEHVPEGNEYDIGYIEPSKQGVRGKTRWIFDESDIEDMYEEYQEAKKTEIIIWCEGRAKTQSGAVKRKGPSESSSKKKPRMTSGELNAKTMDEVDTVYQKLAEMHNGKFDADRLRMWAHLINMGKHSSFETPPDYPFFRKKDKNAQKSSSTSGDSTSSTSSSSTAMSSPPSTCISPAKRSNLRSQYMTQMKEWYSLLDCGAISKEEYEEQKSKILEDLNIL